MENFPSKEDYPKTPDGFESAFEAFLETFPDEHTGQTEWNTARNAFMFAWIAAGGRGSKAQQTGGTESKNTSRTIKVNRKIKKKRRHQPKQAGAAVFSCFLNNILLIIS